VDLIADTTFLVGLWRKQPWAVAYAGQNSTKSIGVPWVVLGEFWHGATRAGHDAEQVSKFLGIGIPLMDASSVIPIYARICAQLQISGEYRNIGQNDLWIAAIAMSQNKPLVTRNQRHFKMIEGLKIEVLDAV
jgi:tRNA(fMet)-specific endonuclease VapC